MTTSAPPGAVATALYSDECPRCAPTVLALLRLFAQFEQPLYVRKPTLSELSIPGFSFPALWIPRNLLKNKDDLLLIGDKLTETATILLEDFRRESPEPT